MHQPPSPGQGHQGQGSETPLGKDVCEIIFLIFWINWPRCQNVPNDTQKGTLRDKLSQTSGLKDQ